jgi:Glycosyl hydrolase family 26
MLERRASGAVARAAFVVAGVALCLGATSFVASAAGGSTVSGSTVSVGEGVYTGAADPSQIAAFDATTGTHSTIAADYLPTNSGWSGMDGRGGSLRWLFAQGWTGTPYTLSLGVPIIPTNSSGHPLGTLARGASGAYNAYFVTLAQTLVAAGESNAYLRLGWEFDGGWTAWNATTPTSETNFAAYFRQIVKAMRSVPGEKFRFVWNPDAEAFTTRSYNVALAYPGNYYVNVIGLDAYDQAWVTPLTPANAWNESTLPALTAGERFATRHDKPLAMDEWGTAIRSDGHGLGDDPLYVSDMIAWIRNPANHVLYEAYFDYDGRGTNSAITDGRFPNSLAAFRSAFKRTDVRTVAAPVRTEAGGANAAWFVLAAVSITGGMGWYWRRRVRGKRRIERVPRRIYPPADDVVRAPVPEWAEQTRC